MRKNHYTTKNYIIAFLGLFFLLTNILTLFINPSFSKEREKKHVLILNSYSTTTAWTNNIVKGIHSALNDKAFTYSTRIEYMDSKNIHTEDYFEKLYELYKLKFNHYTFDVIIASDDDAFYFLKKYHHELFPNTPIVFCGLNNPKGSILPKDPLFTGVVEKIDIKSTIDIALSLHPNTKNIFIINDVSSAGISNKKYLNIITPEYKKRIQFTFYDKLTTTQAQEKLQSLPQNSLILLMGFLRDDFNEVLSLRESCKIISKSCSVPIYSFWDQSLGHGIVGGMIISGYEQGKIAGSMAVEILNGKKVENLPMTKESSNSYMFDYNQMKRFNIHPSDLPKGSTIVNMPSQIYAISKKSIYIFIFYIIFLLLGIILFLLLNISKRKKIEEKLRKSKRAYRKLLEFLPYGLLVHVEGKCVFMNPKGAKTLGAKTHLEFLGTNIYDFLHPSYHDIVRKRIKKLENGYNVELFEEKFFKIDGSCIDVEVSATPFLQKDTVGSMVLFNDITQRKKEEALQKSMEEEKKRLKEAMEYDTLKTEFFSNLSHELKTPLNLIFATTQLLELNLKNHPNTHKSIQILRQNCYRMLRLVNNLIDITKLDAGYFELELQNCNIISIVEDITLSVSEYVESKNISLLFDTNIEEKIMAIDPHSMERIILNLLSNAVKFTSSGDSIFVNMQDKGNYIIISVKDSGIGIPEDKVKVIFDRFRQVDKSLTRNHEGSGIGLSLVHSLVNMYGGSLRVESEYGHGSEFIITLPVKVLDGDNLKNYDLSYMENNHIEKISIEFSDIYSLR